MGTKKGKHSNSEGDALFRSVVNDTQPLRVRKRHLPKTTTSSKTRLRHGDEQQMLQESISSELDLSAPEHIDDMSFQRGSVTRKIMRELRRGKYAVQEEIDLHGCTRPEAKSALQAFINDCVQQGLSCIRVIHGKGIRSGPDGPVLKAAVNHWLRQWDTVLAFCPARPSDGGTGAIYVLLRKH
jgi:DNA-nicking Smr family endonuclease